MRYEGEYYIHTLLRENEGGMKELIEVEDMDPQLDHQVKWYDKHQQMIQKKELKHKGIV